jgi:hypothetical protein
VAGDAAAAERLKEAGDDFDDHDDWETDKDGKKLGQASSDCDAPSFADRALSSPALRVLAVLTIGAAVIGVAAYAFQSRRNGNRGNGSTSTLESSATKVLL